MPRLAHPLSPECLSRRTSPWFGGRRGGGAGGGKVCRALSWNSFYCGRGKLSVSCINGFDPRTIQRASSHLNPIIKIPAFPVQFQELQQTAALCSCNLPRHQDKVKNNTIIAIIKPLINLASRTFESFAHHTQPVIVAALCGEEQISEFPAQFVCCVRQTNGAREECGAATKAACENLTDAQINTQRREVAKSKSPTML